MFNPFFGIFSKKFANKLNFKLNKDSNGDSESISADIKINEIIKCGNRPICSKYSFMSSIIVAETCWLVDNNNRKVGTKISNDILEGIMPYLLNNMNQKSHFLDDIIESLPDDSIVQKLATQIKDLLSKPHNLEQILKLFEGIQKSLSGLIWIDK